ncbi:MAG: type IV toxin-antitoxin system AbiEi family antitoxin domain-containing protein [Acidimicrobiales bacterium]|nr:type IV toxin-antitoxin system AbiEi family antitoxin domain-containing protein [Acidimicrobiales bacterium]
MPTDKRSRLDRWLATHHGVVSRSTLVDLGFTTGAIRHLIATEGWETVYRGVYRSPAHPVTRVQALSAICQYSEVAVIGLTTAGQELGLRKMSDRRIHVLVPHGSGLSLPGVEVHRCRQIDPIDIALPRRDGVRLTSPPRTIFDASALLDVAAIESVIEQVLLEGRCSVNMLVRTGERLHHPTRPGASTFQRAVLGRPAWRGAARSDLEVRFRQAVERHGLPSPAVNTHIEVAPGEWYEMDTSWPEWKVIGEIDHPFWHNGASETLRDRQRDRRLAALGWLTARFDQWDLDHGLDQALVELAAILVDRGWAGSIAA